MFKFLNLKKVYFFFTEVTQPPLPATYDLSKLNEDDGDGTLIARRVSGFVSQLAAPVLKEVCVCVHMLSWPKLFINLMEM